MAENSVTYGLKFQARALAAQVAETSSSRWLVGTLALREDNEVWTALGTYCCSVHYWSSCC